MSDLYHIFTIVGLITGMLLSFKMGYKAAGREDRLIFDTPRDIQIVNSEEDEQVAPKTDEEIREDIKRERDLVLGLGLDE
jgi:hypothetical protein